MLKWKSYLLHNFEKYYKKISNLVNYFFNVISRESYRPSKNSWKFQKDARNFHYNLKSVDLSVRKLCWKFSFKCKKYHISKRTRENAKTVLQIIFSTAKLYWKFFSVQFWHFHEFFFACGSCWKFFTVHSYWNI